MSTTRNVTVVFEQESYVQTAVLPSSTGIERDNIKDMKIGDRIKVYCVPVGEGDYKTDPYLTLDINDALDHLEKYYGIKFATTIKVICSYGAPFPSSGSFHESDAEVKLNMGYYAYKVDRGVLMSNIYAGLTNMSKLNRQNLVTGDGWRLPGPREISKYLVSDLNGTLDPTVNPWKVSTDPNSQGQRVAFYQMPHTGTHDYYFSNGPSILIGHYHNYSMDWSSNNARYDHSYGNYGDATFTSTFLYQYVDSENATNIYY